MSLSATYRLVPSVVIPQGFLKLADVPVPFANPEESPARVVTAVERLSRPPCIEPPICSGSATVKEGIASVLLAFPAESVTLIVQFE